MLPLLLATAMLTSNAESATSQKPDMTWWREARFGLFIHWGLYAVPAGKWGDRTNYGEWIMDSARIPVETYEQFVAKFDPIKFDADEWASLAKEAGMRYLVITTKHHDGFALFDSALSDYDVMATPFKRDIMREIADASRRQGIVPCWYHSIMDWHHPDYLPRRGWETRSAEGADFDRYVAYLKGQVRELLTNYGDIGVMWFDGEWERTWLPRYGADLLAHCRSLAPKTIVNNRVSQVRGGMEDVMGDAGEQHAVGDFGTPEQYIPATGLAGQDWETCMTMGDHWGFNAYETNWKSSEALIRNLVDIVSKGGNYLLNVGPRSDGTFPPECVQRLREIGAWMKVNWESIYGTQASPFDSLDWGRCTMKRGSERTTLYLHVFEWPDDGRLVVPGLGNEIVSAQILGRGPATYRRAESNVVIDLPEKPLHVAATTIELVLLGEPVVYRTPRILSPGTDFVSSVSVVLDVGSDKLEIRYTLDGGDPIATSPRYTRPLVIDKACSLRAATFDGAKRVSDIAHSDFVQVAAWPALEIPRQVRPGLQVRSYSGDWNRLPDFESLVPRSSSVASDIGYSEPDPEEYVGRIFVGFVRIARDGMYEFALTSDDGSRLLIDGRVVVDNDGPHSAETKVGRAPLASGLHAVRVEWFNKTGAAALELTYALIGEKRSRFGAGLLCH